MGIPYIIKSYNMTNHVIRYLKDDDKITIFQSYNTTMCIIHTNPTWIMLNDDEYNFTKTTCKYLYKFIDDFILYDDDIDIVVRDELRKILQSKNIKKSLLKYYNENYKIS